MVWERSFISEIPDIKDWSLANAFPLFWVPPDSIDVVDVKTPSIPIHRFTSRLWNAMIPSPSKYQVVLMVFRCIADPRFTVECS